jgi:CheY-like chemotaxis protein
MMYARWAASSLVRELVGIGSVVEKSQPILARNSHSEIDLILADYAMPTMSGIELAKAIRTTRPALPVILVTGYGNREVMEGLSETRILQKPYTEDELILRIRRAFNER